MPLPLVIVCVVAGLAALALFALGAGALRRGARLAVFLLLLLAVGGLTVAGIALTLGMGMAGFRAVPESGAVAQVEVRATGPGAFTAAFDLGDGRETSFSLPGDTLVVETAIVTWKPMARLAGLATAYRLGAVRGRGEVGPFGATGGAFVIDPEPSVDLAALARRLPPLGLLFDVTSGEATLGVAAEPRQVALRLTHGTIVFRD